MVYPKINDDWIFRETFDSVSSVIENGGVITGTPTISKSGTFNGSTDFIDIGTDSSLDLTGDMTVSALIKLNDVSGSKTIAAKSGATFSSTQWEFLVSNNDLHFLATNGASAFTAISSNDFVADTWYHVVGTISSNVLNVYVDSVVGGSATVTGTKSTTALSTTIGKRTFGGSENYFAGEIKDVRIYNKALSAEEVSDLYQEDTFQEIDDSKALVSLPLRSNYHDGVNQVTENIGSLGGTVKLADGTTTAEFPSQVTHLPKGMVFDGITKHLRFTDPIVPLTGGFSVVAYVRVGGYDNDTNLIICGQYFDSESLRFFCSIRENDCILQIGGTSLIPSFNFIPGQLYHLVFLRESDNTTRIYIDGEELDNGTNATNVDQQEMWIGRVDEGVTDAAFDGEMYNFRVYDFGLTPSQIKALYLRDKRLLNK